VSSLSQLLHHRWSAPILAELHRTSGARFVVLERHLGVSRESLRQTLAALLDAGLVRRNPGYGHPLRPEYLLTEDGSRLAPSLTRLLAVLTELGVDQIGLKKWSMPVVAALDGRRRRFSELREALPAVSPRALALALKDLETAGLVGRRVTHDYPPATVYRLTTAGRRVARVLRALVRD
jgi:DNA-binding HxlR family transcriptional regulator